MHRESRQLNLKNTLSAIALQNLYLTTFCLFLGFPYTELNAEESATPLSFKGEVWQLQQLPRTGTKIPAATNDFEVFTIYKSGDIWTIGSSLYNPDAELLYVDRKKRHIGPFTSSVKDYSGYSVQCTERKSTEKITKCTKVNG